MDALSHAHNSAEKGTHSLSVAIADKFALHASYMPFIKDGAVFVPTSQRFSLHDEVTLQLRLVEEGKKLLVPGRVIWISAGMGHRGTSAGIGLQFTGEHRVRIRQFVEDILGELVKQPAANPAY